MYKNSEKAANNFGKSGPPCDNSTNCKDNDGAGRDQPGQVDRSDRSGDERHVLLPNWCQTSLTWGNAIGRRNYTIQHRRTSSSTLPFRSTRKRQCQTASSQQHHRVHGAEATARTRYTKVRLQDIRSRQTRLAKRTTRHDCTRGKGWTTVERDVLTTTVHIAGGAGTHATRGQRIRQAPLRN